MGEKKPQVNHGRIAQPLQNRKKEDQCNALLQREDILKKQQDAELHPLLDWASKRHGDNKAHPSHLNPSIVPKDKDNHPFPEIPIYRD